jgi:hypothetical protein
MAVVAFLLIRTTVFGNDFSGKAKNSLEKETVQKGIIILVEFPDVKHNVDRNSVQNRFSNHLNSYVKEMSYNKVSLGIDVTKRWYPLPKSVSWYRISSRNLEVDKSRVRGLIDDALDAADKEVDFSNIPLRPFFWVQQWRITG